ncbi:putative ankyrin repeat protein RF_0381 [Saccostrea cucullata]|uniref:putative ankyrin repeat protein RF_0381 n=1 Tax=Saccostrea cuccullata TaxID=36930 RepID=UPI002ED12E25
MAASGGNIELFQILKNQTLTVSLEEGKTVVHSACQHGRLELCWFLLESYPHLLKVRNFHGDNTLHAIALGGNIQLLTFQLEQGLDIRERSSDGKTVLHLCCMKGKIEMCKYLVTMHLELLNITDNDGYNVLHAAAWGGNIDLFKGLQEKGLDINDRSNNGKTSTSVLYEW